MVLKEFRKAVWEGRARPMNVRRSTVLVVLILLALAAPAWGQFQDDAFGQGGAGGFGQGDAVTFESIPGAGIILGLYFYFLIAFTLFLLASLWILFVKADEPGWASIMPIYNIVVLLKISGKPWWWILLYFIPIVSIVIAIIHMIALAEAFGKGAGFGIGLAFLGFIFLPILAFGDADYEGGGWGGL